MPWRAETLTAHGTIREKFNPLKKRVYAVGGISLVC